MARIGGFQLLHVAFMRIRETGVPRLRSWLESLGARRHELAESYRRQHTRHELFYLIEDERGPILVVVSESADLRAGAREFLNSDFPIDVEFKRLVQDIGVGDPAVELVYDSRDLLP